MQYTKEVEEMVCVAKGPNHGPAPIPEEGKWIQAKEIKDISGYTHGIGWCAPQQGTCKLSLNVKNGVKCMSLKCISDTFAGDGGDFNTNVTRSAEKAFRAIREVLKAL